MTPQPMNLLDFEESCEWTNRKVGHHGVYVPKPHFEMFFAFIATKNYGECLKGLNNATCH